VKNINQKMILLLCIFGRKHAKQGKTRKKKRKKNSKHDLLIHFEHQFHHVGSFPPTIIPSGAAILGDLGSLVDQAGRMQWK